MWGTVCTRTFEGEIFMLRLLKWLFVKKVLQWAYFACQRGTFTGKRFLIEFQIVKTMKALPYMIC